MPLGPSCRGGRPDLAGAALQEVRAPTLLIVGGRDTVVITLNTQALEQLTAEKRLEIVPGATHLLRSQAPWNRSLRWRRDWFQQHLTPPS